MTLHFQLEVTFCVTKYLTLLKTKTEVAEMIDITL